MAVLAQLLVSLAVPAQAQQRTPQPAQTSIQLVGPQVEPKPSLGKSVGVGALAGAAIGAAGAASWAMFGEDGLVAPAAGIGAGMGAVNGAITGATIALLPKPRGWRRQMLATAIGAAVSGATCWALGEWGGQGTVRPGAAGSAGLAHGAMTATVTVHLTR